MRVVKVEYAGEYKLKILFSNKKTKLVNLEDKVKNAKGIFLPLKDLDYFKKVALDDCHLSICWPNGADICPDVLYSMGEDVAIEKREKRTKKLRHRRKNLTGLHKRTRHKLPTLKDL